MENLELSKASIGRGGAQVGVDFPEKKGSQAY